MLTSADVLGSPAPLYYERLVPDDQRGDPLVLVHGGAHTGACYRCTPDGRPGWAIDFVRQRFEVIVPDWPGDGRSGYVPRDQISGELIVAALKALIEEIGRPMTLLVHSMSGPYGFKLLEVARPLVKRLVAIAPGPPGNLQPLPEIVNETDDEVEVKVLGDGPRFPRAALDRYRASLVPLPARLLYERQNVNGSQLRLAEDVNLSGSRVLVVTGMHDLDHPRAVDEPIVHWLAEHGATTAPRSPT